MVPKRLFIAEVARLDALLQGLQVDAPPSRAFAAHGLALFGDKPTNQEQGQQQHPQETQVTELAVGNHCVHKDSDSRRIRLFNVGWL
jgi:hypothetical protein